jgi:hypothetical protein
VPRPVHLIMAEDSVTDLIGQITRFVPSWVAVAITAVFGIAAAFNQIKPLFTIILKPLRAFFRPLIVKKSRRRIDAGNRRQFAEHIVYLLRDRGRAETWVADKYAELEAEVEIDSSLSSNRFERRWHRSHTTLVRVPSLSHALARSKDKLVLLRGEPGSGKSFALRHLAEKLAQKAIDRPRVDSELAIYVNLKDWIYSRPVTPDDVRAFVVSQLVRVDSTIEKLVNEQFDQLIDHRPWTFLFDSFDEIPEILSATNADDVVEDYRRAIYDFVYARPLSRGIIASRDFRSPKDSASTKFIIVRLTPDRQRDLINRAGMPPENAHRLFEGLQTAGPAVAQLAETPLFLSLLCEHFIHERSIPTSTHVVFDGHVNRRLDEYAGSIKGRFGISSGPLRSIAETVAFCMTSSIGLGLNPTRTSLRQELAKTGKEIDNLDAALNALEFVRLARTAEKVPEGESSRFSFVHRRIQEYFATCVVLRGERAISIPTLLENGRWRETAVAIMQTQEEGAVEELLKNAQTILTKAAQEVQSSPVNGDLGVQPVFVWPTHSLYLLNLLTAGLVGRPSIVPEGLLRSVGEILSAAWDRGRRYDRKWALEVVVLGTEEVKEKILIGAFSSRSGFLRETAFATLGRVGSYPDKVSEKISSVLVGLSCKGRLRRDRVSIDALLRRLREFDNYQRIVRLLLCAPMIDLALCLVAIIACVKSGILPDIPVATAGLLAVILHTSYYSARQCRKFASVRPRYSVDLVAGYVAVALRTTDDAVLMVLGALPRVLFLCAVMADVVARIEFRFFEDYPIWALFSDAFTPEHLAGLGIAVYCMIWCYDTLYVIADGRFPRVALWLFTPFISVFKNSEDGRVGIAGKSLTTSVAVGVGWIVGGWFNYEFVFPWINEWVGWSTSKLPQPVRSGGNWVMTGIGWIVAGSLGLGVLSYAIITLVAVVSIIRSTALNILNLSRLKRRLDGVEDLHAIVGSDQQLRYLVTYVRSHRVTVTSDGLNALAKIDAVAKENTSTSIVEEFNCNENEDSRPAYVGSLAFTVSDETLDEIARLVDEREGPR